MEPQTTLSPSSRIKPIAVNAEQKSAEWFGARLGNVTGSEVKKIIQNFSSTALDGAIRNVLGVKQLNAKIKESEEYLRLNAMGAFELFELAGMRPPETEERAKYRRQVVTERLTGIPLEADKYLTAEMRWGIMNEKLAIAKYQLKTGNIVQDAPLLLHPDLRAGASPDGMVIDRETGLLGVAEVKCLRTDNHLYKIIKEDVVPDDYIDQIHMEIWISGRDFCDFIGYDSRVPDGIDIYIKRVMRDEEYIQNVLEPSVMRFLDECKRDENFFRMKIREAREKRLQTA